MLPMNRRFKPIVTVEYTNLHTKQRVTKTFACPHKAKSFYVAKDRAGCQPTIRKAI